MNPWRRAGIVSAAVFALTFFYALVRYHVIRATPYSELALFTTNKAVALSSTIIIGLSFLLGPLARFFPRVFERHLPLRKSLGMIGFLLGALHVVMSFVLLSPAKYAKFYTDGALNSLGLFSLGFGVLAFAVFCLVAAASLPGIGSRLTPASWSRIQHLGYLAYAFVLGHVVVMGWKGWQDPKSYAFGMISISLVAALFIVLVFILRGLAAAFPKRTP